MVSRLVKILISIVVTSTLMLACSNDTSFKGGNAPPNEPIKKEVDPPVQPESPKSENAIPQNPDEPPSASLQDPKPTWKFGLKTLEDQKVFTDSETDFIPSVLKFDGDNWIQADLSEWQVKVFPMSQDAASFEYTKVDSIKVNLAGLSGMSGVQADFKHKDGGLGFSQKFVFVDNLPPSLQFFETLSSDPENLIQGFLAIEDNYKISQESIAVYACKKSEEKVETIGAQCALITDASQIKDKNFQIAKNHQVEIESELFYVSELDILVYAEDSVAQSNVAKMVALDVSKPTFLSMTINPEQPVQYINVTYFGFAIGLELIDGESKTKIDLSEESPVYQLEVESKGVKVNSRLKSLYTVNLESGEGEYNYSFLVTDEIENLTSNQIQKTIVVDQTNPTITTPRISLSTPVLQDDTIVTINWNANDNIGVAKQEVLLKTKEDADYQVLATLGGTEQILNINWLNKPKRGFEVYIRVTDLAGNSTDSQVGTYTPQIFNAAILTQAVNCFYCHLKVEGDVGGINFSSNLHEASGEAMEILGKLYATTSIPGLISGKANEDVEFYQNDPIKIFPKDVDGDSSPDFAVLTAEDLKKRMNGTLKFNDTTVSRIHEGNLFVDGNDPDKPFEINGEVLITGDLIIRGHYKGIGTIYANNIYIVDDVLAKDSAFPYPADPDLALEKAKEDIKNKKDGLYLGALNQLLVGDVDGAAGALADPEFSAWDLVDPYSWMPKDQFEGLGRQAVFLKNGDVDFRIDNSFITDPTTDGRVNLEVNQVDAYLFSQTHLYWRSYASILNNGGFMGPRALLISSTSLWLYRAHADAPILNPRHGLPANRNVVRYDYRLRAGGGGFESLKQFFDQ